MTPFNPFRVTGQHFLLAIYMHLARRHYFRDCIGNPQLMKICAEMLSEVAETYVRCSPKKELLLPWFNARAWSERSKENKREAQS